MKPHPSILFFTVLAGAGQGLFVVLAWLESQGVLAATPMVAGMAWLSLALLAGGLVASVFHLGRPERAWRAASQWRTSWLSREVIVLPALMATVLAHAALLRSGAPMDAHAVRWTGLAGSLLAILLWWCTGMIYASLRMVQAWATPLTPLAFGAMGLASGATLAAAWLAWPWESGRSGLFVLAQACELALMATLLAATVKTAWTWRLRRLVPRSTPQTALAIPRPHIRQMAMGMTGGSFNTREFFHGAPASTLSLLPWVMVLAGVVVPLFAEVGGLRLAESPAPCFLLAAASQLAGWFAERWLFFAWAQHPQNLYYQRAS